MKDQNSLKILKQTVLIAFVLIIGLFIFLNLFLMVKGKELLSQRLSQATNRKIVLNKVWFKLPFSIFIDGITVDGISPAKEILVKLGFSNVFRSQFIIKRIVLNEAVILLTRDQNGKVSLKGLKSFGEDAVIGLIPETKPADIITQQASDKVIIDNQYDKFRITINNIILQDSLLEFNNEMNANAEDKLNFKKVMLEQFELRIKDFVWPLESRPMAFHLKGMLSIPDFALNQKSLKSDGWINPIKKDMKGDLDVAESESQSSLHAVLTSKDNDMLVKGNIKMSNFMKPFPKGESNSKGIDQMIFGALSQMGVEVGLDFSFQTKMDQFEMRNVSFTGNVVTKQLPSGDKKPEIK